LLQLRLESGTIARLEFDPQPPTDGLQFSPGAIMISIMEDQFADAYQMLRTEESAFCTTINLFGIRVGAVHRARSDRGRPGTPLPIDNSIEALAVRANDQNATAQARGNPATSTGADRRGDASQDLLSRVERLIRRRCRRRSPRSGRVRA
jgi:hypothetical protein